MSSADKTVISTAGETKELSELFRNHFTTMEYLSEKFRDEIRIHLASENLQADEGEKTILLDLSNEIAAAKNKEDLCEVIHAKLKTFFKINGLSIILLNHQYQTYQLYMFQLGDSSPDDRNLKNKRESLDFSDLRPILKKFANNQEQIYFDTLESVKDYPQVEYFRAWKEKGWERFSVTELQLGNDTLGYLILHLEKLSVGSLRTNLLKGICAQFSVALSNINMIEEALTRKNEMEQLLSINIGIASIRSTDNLAKFIKDKFKQLLGCSHTLIAVFNDDGLTFNAFLLDEDAKSKANPIYLDFKDSNNKINDAVLSKVMQTGDPLLFDLEELAQQKELPLYVKINQDLRQKVLLITRLAKGDEVFGFWLIYFKDKSLLTGGKLKLIQSLSHQLSVSVANILANQEIKSREDEKSRLLKFSNAIAPVRDYGVLSQILKVQLQEIFGIKEYIIHLFNKEQNKYIPFLYDNDVYLEGQKNFSNTTQAWTDVEDGFLEFMSSIDGSELYNLNEQVSSFFVNAQDYASNSILNKPRIGMLIHLGLEGIAILSFTHPNFKQIKQKEELLKSICSQISVAMCNIIANEKVNHQLLQIDRYKQQLEEETIYLKEEIETNQNYAEIIGESSIMQKTFRLVAQVAPADSTVLILGETGTGKELIARAIHNNSPRKNKLMVKVNCAALPANLIESELFGHEKGSFTGATERRLGKFELAHNGTLFLDEIGEMPLELQVKLLRALQEKEIERVGGRGAIKVDVRIIAATNRDLEKEVEEGRFRSDLYYRLNIFPIFLAALRDRKEDIPMLATHFIHRYSKKTGRQITTLGSKALHDMIEYSWPGNIRELEHLIERSILLSTGSTLKQIHLPTNKLSNARNTSNAELALKTIDENECEHILRILKYCNGRKSGKGGAADILGVPPSTLNSKIKRLGIKKEHIA